MADPYELEKHSVSGYILWQGRCGRADVAFYGFEDGNQDLWSNSLDPCWSAANLGTIYFDS